MSYTLNYGIWNNAHSVTSRDVADTGQFATRAEAVAALEHTRKYLQGIGYEIWFSKITKTKEKTE